MYRLKIQNLHALFEQFTKSARLFLPIKCGDVAEHLISGGGDTQQKGSVNFTQWNSDVSPESIDLVTLKTTKPPKEFFLPHFEELYSATNRADGFDINPKPIPDAPFILFGVRACDFEGIGVLDRVYLSDPVDRFYEARRNTAAIFTLSCESPTPTCFCNSFGIDPEDPGGDVSMWLTEDYLFMKPITEKGADLMEPLKNILEEAPPDIPFSHKPNPFIPVSSIDPESLISSFNSDKWDSLHRSCISCGTCTFLCPTCQCYDISDFSTGETVRCHRTWDSCMYKDFTQMAHGNPRQSAKARFRQRFMHKLLYHGEKHGDGFSCVGCGRCTNKCPVNLSIVKVIRALGANKNA